MGTEVIWRLEGGYSRFVSGSKVELRLEKKPFRQSLEVSPSGLVHRSKPIDLIFRVTQGLKGRGPGGVGWRVDPEAVVRSVILFVGNAFLGNFRVSPQHFAIQWNLEVNTEATAGLDLAPFLVEVGAKTRLYHSWVTIFPEGTSLVRALQEGWKSYRNPLDPDEVFEMPDRQVVRWRWSGRVRLAMGVQWALGAGWALTGTVPLVKIQKGLSSLAALGAQVEAVEEGEFNIQLRRRAGTIEFRLRRHRERKRQASLSAGVHLGSQVRVVHLGPTTGGPLQILSQGLQEPLRRKMNQLLKQALGRRLEVALALESSRWRRTATVLAANWPRAPA